MNYFQIKNNKVYYNDDYTNINIILTNNCKYSIFENANSLLYYSNYYKVDFIQALKEILHYHYITVQFHVNREIAKLITDNFEYYYNIKVPIGYNENKDTYFILLKNTYSNQSNKEYLRPQEIVSN